MANPVNSLFVLLAAAIGVVAWAGWWDPLVLLSLALPMLWSAAPSRVAATARVAAYYAGASWGLLIGASSFFGSALTGAAIYAGAVAILTLPWAALWGKQGHFVRGVAAGLVGILPPIGLVGWCHPALSGGFIVPGGGAGSIVAGLVAMGIGASSQNLKASLVRLAAGLGIAAWILSFFVGTADKSFAVRPIDTRLGYAEPGFDQLQILEGVIKDAVEMAKPGELIVLPEAIGGEPEIALDYFRQLRDRAARRKVDVWFGGRELSATGARNVLVDLVSGDIVTESRIPVPVSMYAPWSTGRTYRMHPFRSGIVDFRGRKVAVAICYETLLVWPGLKATLTPPEVLIVPANDWFDRSGNVEAVQRLSARLWGRILGVPSVVAVNR